jgi:hypothetical protein
MGATFADRLLARDDDLLVPVRGLGRPWDAVHLAGGAAPGPTTSVRALLTRPPLACAARPHGLKRLAEALLFATAGPSLAALVTGGITLSCRADDIGVRLDRELRVERVELGFGAVGVMHGAEVDVPAAALMLAPMLGAQLDVAIDELLAALAAHTGDDEAFRNLFRDRLRLLRHAIVRGTGEGGVAIDDALQRVAILARRRSVTRVAARAS